MERKLTRVVRVGDVKIGGDNMITVQSMCSTDTKDIAATLRQIGELSDAGCDIVRLAVPDIGAVKALSLIREKAGIPIVADIHFDYKLAIEAVNAGADKIRINPGNLGGADKLEKVARACLQRGVPIRIGVNAGSIEEDILKKYGAASALGMVKSAFGYIERLNSFGFYDIVVSLKASSVATTIEAYRLFSKASDYPLHIGVTEAGTYRMGLIKSSVGIGSLLCDGIGDTVRVSLTADPRLEVEAGRNILRACGIQKEGIEIISCPTCGRCRLDIMSIADRLEQELKGIKTPVKVAVMGCAVNGPGEAREADIGLAGGDGMCLMFKRGIPFKSVPEDKIVAEMIEEINNMVLGGVGL